MFSNFFLDVFIFENIIYIVLKIDKIILFCGSDNKYYSNN